MSATPPRLFRSSARRGFSDQVTSNPARIFARKVPREIQVEFAAVACAIQTPEGTVQAQPGDAILTGTAGERWRVTRARFGEKYQPVAPTVAGSPGRYVSLPNQVVAVRMDEPFQVLLSDGQSLLTGRPGEWLVDYGDGSLGIIAAEIFATTYRIEG